MIESLKRFEGEVKPKGKEDEWFSSHLTQVEARVNTMHQGRAFAVESMPHPSPFGVSYSMRTISKYNRAQLLTNCPEARVLVGYLPLANWLLAPEKCYNTGADNYVGPFELHRETQQAVYKAPCPVDNF